MSRNIYKPKNSKNYYLRVSIDGKEYRESLQTSSQRAAQVLARKRVAELKQEAQTGEPDWLFHVGFTSFYDVLATENASPAGWAATTRKRYITSLLQIGQTLADIFAERGIDIEDVAAWEITVAEIAEFVSMRKDSQTTNSTINRDLTAFAHLMTHIKNKGWIEVNPVRLFEKQGMRESLPDVVMPSQEAIERLALRAPGTLTYFPSFLAETGGRVGEMAMTQWRDVNGLDNPAEGHVTLTLT